MAEESIDWIAWRSFRATHSQDTHTVKIRHEHKTKAKMRNEVKRDQRTEIENRDRKQRQGSEQRAIRMATKVIRICKVTEKRELSPVMAGDQFV